MKQNKGRYVGPRLAETAISGRPMDKRLLAQALEERKAGTVQHLNRRQRRALKRYNQANK